MMRKSLLTTLLCLAAGFAQTAPGRHRILFNRFRMPEIEIMIADGDGKNERVLAPHEGIEYSPSYSADGKWVVFTGERGGLSDIYRIHPDGTGVERLTDDPAFDDQGVLSPDGRSLAFVSTRGSGTANLWLLDLSTRKCRALTSGQAGNFRPAWSPDGAWIAFSSDRDATPGVFPGQWETLQSTGIYLVRPDGSGLRRLTKPGGVAGSPAWSADGKRILFYETDEVGAFLAKSARSRTELVSVDVDTGERRQHTASNDTKLWPKWLPGGRIGYAVRGGGASGGTNEGIKIWYPDRRIVPVVSGAVRNPSWAADGGRLVYERVLKPATTEHLLPTASRDPEFELLLSEPFPSFSADGRRLLYSQYANGGTGAGDTSIEIMNADGSDQRTLYHEKGAAAYDASWSPGGDTILFSVGRYFRSPGLPAAQIATIRPDGSGFRAIVDDGINNGFPNWSPDGKKIVYRRGKQLVIRTLADGTSAPLTDGSHYDNFPEWAPNGSVILFTSDRSDGRFELYTIRPDGTDLKRLTNVPGSNAHAAWSPDGGWIVFTSGRRGFKDEMATYDGVPQPYGEIFAMRADGSDARQLTDNKWEDASAGWAPEGSGHPH